MKWDPMSFVGSTLSVAPLSTPITPGDTQLSPIESVVRAACSRPSSGRPERGNA